MSSAGVAGNPNIQWQIRLARFPMTVKPSNFQIVVAIAEKDAE
jgi:hypothetical protein